MGCNGNSDSDRSAPDIVLVDLLPATTRGYLQLSHAAGSVPSGWEELAGDEGAQFRREHSLRGLHPLKGFLQPSKPHCGLDARCRLQ